MRGSPFSWLASAGIVTFKWQLRSKHIFEPTDALVFPSCDISTAITIMTGRTVLERRAVLDDGISSRELPLHDPA